MSGWWFWHAYSAATINRPTERLTGRLARAFGHLAELNLCLVLLPVPRSSLWQSVFRIPVDRLIPHHQTCGWVLALSMCGHAGCWLVKWVELHKLKVCISLDYQRCGTRAGMLWSGLALMIVSAVLFCTALPCIRRRVPFEVFYWAHHLYLALIPLAVYHSITSTNGMLLHFLPIPVALWAVDRLYRLRSSTQLQVVTAQVTPCGTTTRLVLGTPASDRLSDTSSFGAAEAAGKWVLINIGEVSKSEWHPISLSSPDEVPDRQWALGAATTNDGQVTLHIKAGAPGSWSDKLRQLAQAPGHSGATTEAATFSPHVAVDGPFGGPSIDLASYRTVLLVAGGVGITPVMSQLRQLIRGAHRRCSSSLLAAGSGADSSSQRAVDGKARPLLLVSPIAEAAAMSNRQEIRLVWVVRSEDSLLWFADTLRYLQSAAAAGAASIGDDGGTGSSLSISVELYVTAASQPHSHSTTGSTGAVAASPTPLLPRFTPATRPDLDSIAAAVTIDAVQSAIPGHRAAAALFVCGPAGLMAAADQACARQGEKSGIVFDVHREQFAFLA